MFKALARPRGEAVFIRANEDGPTQPDQYYLALLREDTLVLVVKQKDLYPREP